MKRYFLSLAILLLLLVPSTVMAQTVTKKLIPTPTPLRPLTVPETGVNVTLSPTFLSLIAEPGHEVGGEFKIRNNNNFTEYFEFSLAKFEAAEGGERPLLVPLTKSDEFQKWLSFSEKQISIDAGETRRVSFTVTPPKSASLGYYYAIVINRIQEKKDEGNGAVVAGAPALLTLLEVKTPNAKRELSLVDFSSKQLIYEYLPAEFTIKVKNNGNIHTAPVGDIFIDSGNKKNIAVLHINEGRGNVLPATTRSFFNSWSDGFAVRVPKMDGDKMVRDSKNNVVMETKYDFAKADRFRVGKYTAHLLLVYDNGERDVPVEGTVTFWVIPWKILGGVGLLVILALFGIKSIVMSNINRLRKR